MHARFLSNLNFRRADEIIDMFFFFRFSLNFIHDNIADIHIYMCVHIFSRNYFVVNKYESENRAEAEDISR